MAALNPLTRELVFKVVFYGPGLGGKTTTLQHIHATAKPEHRGNLVSLATDTDRTLYFDFLPLQVLKLRNMSVRLQLFTVPGQVYYGATRKLVLTGADGIVFVADSQNARYEANQESLDDLNANLAEHGRSLSHIPHAFQWNKRDLTDVVPVADLDRRLNLFSAPSIGTIATRGDGVFPGLEQITRAVFNAYKAELPKGKREAVPLFLDAEEVGLADAIRELADSQRERVPSSPSATLVAGDPASAGARALEGATGQVASRSRPIPITSPSARAPVVTRAPAPAPEESAPTTPPPPVADEEVARPSPLPTNMAPALPTTLAPLASAHFTLSDYWPEQDREGVRRAETLIGARDATSSVLACDILLTRILAEVSVAIGQADHAREPALLAMLLGISGARYLAFRAAVRAARQKKDVTTKDALDCYVLAIEARRALDAMPR